MSCFRPVIPIVQYCARVYDNALLVRAPDGLATLTLDLLVARCVAVRELRRASSNRCRL